jgi:hypothetical protein
MKDKELVSLKQIEGKVSPHHGSLEHGLKQRVEALEYVDDVSSLAAYVGGAVESVAMNEDWAIKKEIFPGVDLYFIFNRGDEEFPGTLRALYSGDRVMMMSGEDLSGLTIAVVTHMLRYVRESNPDKQLPEVCYRV